MDNKIKLFTHTDLDGIGCAILFKNMCTKLCSGLDIEYCGYDTIDERVGDMLDNHTYNDYMFIFVTGLSISDQVAKQINERGLDTQFFLLDHHNTASHLNVYPWASVTTIDENGNPTSSTKMLYDFFKSVSVYDESIYTPDEIRLISMFVDRVRYWDVWRWKAVYDGGIYGSECKQLNDLLSIYGRDYFIEWVLKRFDPVFACGKFPAFSSSDGILLQRLQSEIERYINKKDKEMIELCNTLVTLTEIIYHPYGVVFADRYTSELGEALSRRHPDLHYIMIVDIGAGRVSYRTVRDDIDLCADIAYSFGGGGHAQAAGSTFIKNYVVEAIIDELNNQRPLP